MVLGGGACFYERGTPVQREEGFFIDGQLVRSERFIICKATEGNTSVGKETHEMFSRCKANESQLMMQVQQKQVCFPRCTANQPCVFVYSVYTIGVIFFCCCRRRRCCLSFEEDKTHNKCWCAVYSVLHTRHSRSRVTSPKPCYIRTPKPYPLNPTSPSQAWRFVAAIQSWREAVSPLPLFLSF